MALSGKGVAFDNGVHKSPDLTVSFTRATATKDVNGTARAVNQPRYGKPLLLAGLVPDAPTSHYAVGQCVLLAAGYAADNATKLWLVRHDAGAQMILWSGTFSGAGSPYSHNLTGAPGRAAGAITALNTAGATTDLFRGQSSQTNYVNECWVPKSAVIVGGEIAVLCQVYYNPTAESLATGGDAAGAATARTVAGNWKGYYVGVAFCKASTWLSSPGTGWRTTPPRSGALHAATAGSIGTTWVLRADKLDRDGTPPLKVWISGVDYQGHPNANGGISFCVPLVRSTTTSDDWSEDEVTQTFATSLTGDVRHVHASICVRTGTLGIRQYTSIGDGSANQAVVVTELTSEVSATAHDTAYRAGGTVAADARRWRTGTLTNWSAIPATGTGSGIDSGTLDATGEVTPGVNSATVYAGNQFVGAAFDGSLIIGTDESSDALVRTSPASPGTPLTWTPLWTPQKTRSIPSAGTPSNVSGVFQSFHLKERSPLGTGTGFIALATVGAGFPCINESSRFIWSPDGINCAAIYPAGASADKPLRHLDGRLYYNSSVSAVSSIGEPTSYRVVRPLQLAPGGFNYANLSYTVVDTSLGQATITEIAAASAPAGLPAMAGTTNALHIVHPGTSSAGCCTIRLADTVPITAKEVIIKFWLYNTPCADRSPVVSSALNLGYYVVVAKNSDGSSPTTSGNLLRQSHVVQGRWIPVTLRVALPPLLAFGTGTARITLGLSINNGQAGPYDFYFARDSVTVCDATTGADRSAYPITPQATGADESLTIGGFSAAAASDFTLAATVHVPREPFWDDSHAIVFHATDAVNVSATTTTLTGGPSTDYITGGLLRIGDSTNSGACGVRISAYNTTTKLATHDALVGVSAGAVTATVFKPLYDTTASIDRPRQLLALLTEDEQSGLVIFAHTSRSLDGIDGHSFGIAKITAGAVDWTVYSNPALGTDFFQAGDIIHLSLTSDSSNTAFVLGASSGGRAIVTNSDFGAIWNLFTTEVFTKIKVGGIDVPTPIDLSDVWIEPSVMSEADIITSFASLEFNNSARQSGGSTHNVRYVGRTSRFSRH